ncbi:replication protein A [Thiomicrospira aerophila AL3]|uniref:Replication protein A n=1 Tax=Thiomicrospira aerophila AL3 TaxID=717772 RepID=W0DSF8_9GAMM|nr:replication initiation protein [Thiomicrospira aerophila]AHF01387.1 replication protein A [Thiomicrospira aerophila AL3]
MSHGLTRLLDQAPYYPRCSDNKTAARVLPREYAIKQPYMQVNQPGLASWLVFDLDHTNSWIWEDEGLPEPNLIVSNPKNGSSHIFYAIKPVCTSDNAHLKPIRYMKAVYKAMAKALNADPAYSGPVAKTPFHAWWRTAELHTYEYELGDLAKSLTLELAPLWSDKERNMDDIEHSRHCYLFERIRHQAYALKSQHSCYKAFHDDVETIALKSNNFKQEGFAANLRISEVKATVKSICRWTWEKYTGKGGNRGVMQLSKAMPLHKKQALAAKHTHAARRKTSEQKVRQAIRILSKDHKKITINLIAQFAKLSRQTVAKYKSLINPAALSEGVISLKEAFNRSAKNVKNAVYQITAPGRVSRGRFATLIARASNDAISGDSRPIFRPTHRPLGRSGYSVRRFLHPTQFCACWRRGEGSETTGG